MCEDCFEKNIMSFPSQEDYDNFINTLDEKIKVKKMRLNNSLETTNNIMGIDFRTYATCNSCGENWVLETPSYANRGYFLNDIGIEKYYEIKESDNRKVRRNGLIIIAIILTIIIYKCT